MSFLFKIDSSVALLITLKSITTFQALKKGKKSSSVWAHIRMPLENKNSNLFYCSYYKQGPIAERAPFSSKKSSTIVVGEDGPGHEMNARSWREKTV
jgi:hypothetical protein